MFVDSVKDNFVNRDLKVSKLNLFFKRKNYSQEVLNTKNIFSKIEVDNFVIKVAEKKSQLKKLKHLGTQSFTKKKKRYRPYRKKF